MSEDFINDIELSDVFRTSELQQLQDLFSNATGVASIITKPDGTPITKPSNFCRLCNEIIRGTEKGLRNCKRSDSELGKLYPGGPRIQPCLSGGLWDAGASIIINGKHLANWMIGQIRNEELDEAKINKYADYIGADREAYMEAYKEVPVMPTERFNEIASLLYNITNNLSERAFRSKKLEWLILEQKKIEDQLRQSEERYRLLVENQSDIIVEVDASNNLKYVSPSYCKIFGKERSELLGKSFFPLVHPDDVENTKEIMKQLYVSPYSCKVVQRAMTVNGWRWFSWSDKAVINYKGEIESIIGVGRDITERRNTEKKLEESEKKYRNLVENSMVGVIQYIPERVFSFANKTALSIFEVENIDELSKDKQKKFFKNIEDWKYIESLLKEKKLIENYELTIITPKGNEKNLLINLSYNDMLIDGTFIDITERKQAEKEIQLKNEQLHNSNLEKDKFFSIIAHDLRSPFNSFLGLTHLMAEDINNMTLEQIQKIAVTLSKSANNVNNLLENLLNWSRSKRGLINFEPEYHFINKIIGHCSESCIETAKNKEIRIEFDIPDNLKVFADINMLLTTLRNVVSNSLKFSKPEDKIIVSAQKTDNEVVFKVTDTGIGMNKKIRDNLFKMDVNTTRKGTGGEPSTGLGLLLCKEFVERHGGKIWAESVEGKGSSFYLSFPDKKN